MSKNLKNQQEQVKNLKTYYGNSLDLVEVTLPLTEIEMLDIFGQSCSEYNRGCYLCRLWDQWQHNYQKVTVTLSRNQIVEALGFDINE